MTNEELFAELDRRHAEYEKVKKEFAETRKPAVCMNGACKREIQQGDTICVVPFKDEIFCSTECLAHYYGGCELEFDADDNDYASWFEKKELGE